MQDSVPSLDTCVQKQSRLSISTMVKAIVIGAGIGGLAAAIALRQAGVEVTVFERAEALNAVGAGISLWANAIHALGQLGISESLQAVSSDYSLCGLQSPDGKVLVSVSMSELQRNVGVPIVVLHRAELLSLLLNALGTEQVRLNHRCIGFYTDADKVIVEFADGSREIADLLIGADGLNSIVRSELYGKQRPRYFGCTAWRAVVPIDSTIAHATETWGNGKIFGCVPMSGNRVYWYATHNEPEARQFDDDKEKLLQLFRGWHSPIEQLIRATPEKAILRNDIFDRPILRSWSKGRVTLLGDSAHPMTPFLGQGGCQALEDAVVLGKFVGTQNNIEAALQAYDRVRVPRANAIVRQSRSIGRIAQLQHPIAVRIRNAAFAFVTPKFQANQMIRIIDHKV